MTDPNPEERLYLDLLTRVWEAGDERRDRTGVGTRSLFGPTLRFDLSGGRVPLLTTKRVAWKTAAREMLWFLSGDTNIRGLVRQKVHIWTDWPLAAYVRATGEAIDRDTFEARILADDAFAARWGELGPVYGKQWVDWPVYEPAGDGLYRRRAKGIDQIAALLESLRTNPMSRRHIFTGWNVAELDGMALPPCHMTYQYHVARGKLSGMLWQRSCDLGLGFAFNAFSAALLIRMLAQQCDLEPGELVWSCGDAHVYLNHEHLVAEQTAREPRAFPTLCITRRPATIFDYAIEDFVVEGYDPHPHIAAPVAV
ncbi:thymidylate synthase [Sphingomonas donggukensis]|uniref:Thymidylate synthase n=1 Tax=Sphingomonas donggukensis TaxID=2949093 RepID=A0ABY4TXA4_9SPHN|nr:thymidylate synthase [Sphingomonas donggukensis]URW75784.1 thymidylate synthase [Sphingomonas donggukensis]